MCTSRHSREHLLVYEFISNDTVAEHIHKDGAKPKSSSLPWSVRLDIGIETATALAYLHASKIVHRDIKTNNILLDSTFSVKVANFGISRFFPTDATHSSTQPQGTIGYLDPDYYQSGQVTEKSDVDVYSFGIVLLELISSMPALDRARGTEDINLKFLTINRIGKGAFREVVDPILGFDSDASVKASIEAVAELAISCLHEKKANRPTMGGVLERLKNIQRIVHGSGIDVAGSSGTVEMCHIS